MAEESAAFSGPPSKRPKRAADDIEPNIGTVDPSPSSSPQQLAYPSRSDFLITPIIMNIASYASQHLSLRLISRQFNEALCTLHRIGECENCIMVCSSWIDFMVGRLQAPWMRCFNVTRGYADAYTPSNLRSMWKQLENAHNSKHVDLAPMIHLACTTCDDDGEYQEFEEDDYETNPDCSHLFTRMADSQALLSSPLLSSLTSLEITLNWGQADFDEEQLAAEQIVSCEYLTNVQKLKITHTWSEDVEFGVGFMSSLAQSPFMKNITSFSCFLHCDDDVFHKFAANPNVSSLRVLDIESYGRSLVTPTALKAFVSSPYLAGLEELRLTGVLDMESEDDECVTTIASASSLTNLSVLALLDSVCGDTMKISKIGFEHLANSPALRSLRSLTLPSFRGSVFDFCDAMTSLLYGSSLNNLEEIEVPALKRKMDEKPRFATHFYNHPKMAGVTFVEPHRYYD